MNGLKKYSWIFLSLLFICAYIGLVAICVWFIRDDVLAQVIADILASIIGAVVYFKFLEDKDVSVFRPQAWFWVLFVCFMILVWLVGQLTGTMLANHIHDAAFEKYSNMAQSSVTLYGLLSVFIAPFAEEIVFRGLVYTTLRKHMKSIIAGLIAAVLFSLMHGTIVHLPVGFIVGFVAAYMYEMSGHLWMAILVHFLFNALTASVIVPVSEFLISVPFCVCSCIALLVVLCLGWKYISDVKEYVTTEHLIDQINKKPE